MENAQAFEWFMLTNKSNKKDENWRKIKIIKTMAHVGTYVKMLLQKETYFKKRGGKKW